MVKGIATASLFSALASSLSVPHVYADGPLNFPPFNISPAPSPAVSSPENLPESEEKPAPPRVRNDHPRTTSAGFDPEALERGAKALKEINSSTSAKQVLINPLIYVHFYYFYSSLGSSFCCCYRWCLCEVLVGILVERCSFGGLQCNTVKISDLSWY